jgi:CO/xanthine dehydrogenase Mo-binding subunit
MIRDAVRRKEDDHLVTGRTTWTANLRPTGTLHLAFLRSPVAHGRLLHLDVSKAAAQPGVIAVLTGTDLRRPVRFPSRAWACAICCCRDPRDSRMLVGRARLALSHGRKWYARDG